MLAPVPPNNAVTRYAAVRTAAIELVRSLGPLINVGAALFPHGNIDEDQCTDGAQVFPVAPGDPIDGDGMDGPTTSAFALTTNVEPKGGTPVAATLEKLAPTIDALPGRTFVLLLTDGGPNCNPDASCDIDECMLNIEGVCEPTENCCAATHPQGGPEHCLDRA